VSHLKEGIPSQFQDKNIGRQFTDGLAAVMRQKSFNLLPALVPLMTAGDVLMEL